MCDQAKITKQKANHDILLHTPSQPWEDLYMNFMLGFLRTLCGHDSTFIMLDRFYKMAHFLPYLK